MIFLIDYDRLQGRVITLREFADSDRAAAENARLELELEQHRLGVEREVVILEAVDLSALQRSHGRYFKDLRELISDLESSIPTYAVRDKKEFVVRERKD